MYFYNVSVYIRNNFRDFHDVQKWIYSKNKINIQEKMGPYERGLQHIFNH